RRRLLPAPRGALGRPGRSFPRGSLVSRGAVRGARAVPRTLRRGAARGPPDRVPVPLLRVLSACGRARGRPPLAAAPLRGRPGAALSAQPRAARGDVRRAGHRARGRGVVPGTGSRGVKAAAYKLLTRGIARTLRTPQYLILFLSDSCWMKCAHCWFSEAWKDQHLSERQLSFDELS